MLIYSFIFVCRYFEYLLQSNIYLENLFAMKMLCVKIFYLKYYDYCFYI